MKPPLQHVIDLDRLARYNRLFGQYPPVELRLSPLLTNAHEASVRHRMEEDRPQEQSPHIVPREAASGEKPSLLRRREMQPIELWGDQLPPWLRLSAPVEILQEGESASEHLGPLQRKENRTGLPDHMKASVENLSGLSLDDVQVHSSSSLPSQVGAFAYTQGTDIYIGPGQEEHLAHEAWHVVQQKQGRVQPNLRIGGAIINNDPLLELEAHRMGREAIDGHVSRQAAQEGGRTATNRYPGHPLQLASTASHIIQRVICHDMNALWSTVGVPAPILQHLDPTVQAAFTEVEPLLSLVDVVRQQNLPRLAEAEPGGVGRGVPYVLNYRPGAANQDWFVASILHELLHVSADYRYQKAGAHTDFSMNFNFPPGLGPPLGQNEPTDEFIQEVKAQQEILDENLKDAITVAQQDGALNVAIVPGQTQDLPALASGKRPSTWREFVLQRLEYAAGNPNVHYETVLADCLTYLQLSNAPGNSPTFQFLRRLLQEAADRRLKRPWWGVKRARRVRKDASRFHVWEW